ncbi:MAG: hypothetical protein D6679_00280 [Candidatus Hydrogenedentota bacterium]|nr:MAG: hypothetical protein D6679_00280 [Candidatus Hydrogenedentota bacterium]
MIGILLDAPEVEVGGKVAGRVVGTPEKKWQAVAIEVGWRTEGRGTPEQVTVATVRRTPEEDGAFIAGASIPVDVPFEVEIPSEGPISYDGQIVRFIWCVSATLEIPWARDEKKEVVFRVVPRFIEI